MSADHDAPGTPVEREAKGRFPSTRCHCHFAEPYGFVPEADCPEHDTPQFREFLSYVIHWNETHD